MSARHRDNRPPYEIMGSRAPGAGPGGTPGRGPTPRGGLGAGIGGLGRSLLEAWHAGASEPLMLRVPRGMALSLLAGGLLLLVLAYWVGFSRGNSTATQRVRAEYEPALIESGRVPPTRGGVESTFVGQESPPSALRGYDDPRIPGRNYMVLALYPPQEARRLQGFLAGRQVDVMVGPRNNKGLCQVVSLNGFTREQMRDTDTEERFRTKLLGIGRDWRASNQDKGDDLSSMYYSKYEPPAGP